MQGPHAGAKESYFIAKPGLFKQLGQLSGAFHLGTTNIIQPTFINHDIVVI